MEESIEELFVIGQKVMSIGSSWRAGELCKVTGVMLKSVWVKAIDGWLFLRRKDHMVIEAQQYTVKHRTDE